MDALEFLRRGAQAARRPAGAARAAAPGVQVERGAPRRFQPVRHAEKVLTLQDPCSGSTRRRATGRPSAPRARRRAAAGSTCRAPHGGRLAKKRGRASGWAAEAPRPPPRRGGASAPPRRSAARRVRCSRCTRRSSSATVSVYKRAIACAKATEPRRDIGAAPAEAPEAAVSSVPWGLDALGEKLQTLITHRGGDRTEARRGAAAQQHGQVVRPQVMKTRADRGTSVESRGRRSSHAESLLPGSRRSHTGERLAASSLDGGGGDAAEFGTARDAARDRVARLMNRRARRRKDRAPRASPESPPPPAAAVGPPSGPPPALGESSAPPAALPRKRSSMPELSRFSEAFAPATRRGLARARREGGRRRRAGSHSAPPSTLTSPRPSRPLRPRARPRREPASSVASAVAAGRRRARRRRPSRRRRPPRARTGRGASVWAASRRPTTASSRPRRRCRAAFRRRATRFARTGETAGGAVGRRRRVGLPAAAAAEQATRLATMER